MIALHGKTSPAEIVNIYNRCPKQLKRTSSTSLAILQTGVNHGGRQRHFINFSRIVQNRWQHVGHISSGGPESVEQIWEQQVS